MTKITANNIVVMKFGGTSVQDSIAVKNVLQIVKKEKRNKIVVVSAIAKATNSLEEIARVSAGGKNKTSRHYSE